MIAVEEPVTARIRRPAGERSAVDGEGEQNTEAQDEWQRSLAEETKVRSYQGLEPG